MDAEDVVLAMSLLKAIADAPEHAGPLYRERIWAESAPPRWLAHSRSVHSCMRRYGATTDATERPMRSASRAVRCPVSTPEARGQLRHRARGQSAARRVTNPAITMMKDNRGPTKSSG